MLKLRPGGFGGAGDAEQAFLIRQAQHEPAAGCDVLVDGIQVDRRAIARRQQAQRCIQFARLQGQVHGRDHGKFRTLRGEEQFRTYGDGTGDRHQLSRRDRQLFDRSGAEARIRR